MDPISLVIVGLVCLAIGFLGGRIVNTLRADKKSTPSIEPAPSSPGEPNSPELIHVAGFLRNQESGPLLVKMDAKIVSSETELSSDQRASLEDLLLELRTWLGYKPFTTEQHPVQELPDQLGEDLFGKNSGVFTDVVSPMPAMPVSAPPFTGSKSIVGQIDDILQEKLQNTAHANRRIRLTEKPNQGVVVQIGLDSFPGIDEVPDPEIRELIHQAVTEWENQAR